MSLTETSVTRSTDPSGDEIKTFKDAEGRQVQAVGFTDADGDHAGIPTNPLTVDLPQAQRDAFGRLRVSQPETVFDSKLIYGDAQPLFWDEQLETGAGITATTPTAAKPYIDFASTINVAGVFTRQTFRRFNYQPGKGQLVSMTAVLGLSGGGTGVKRRIGMFDDSNGAFFEDDAGTIKVTLRSNDSGSPVEETEEQSAWSLDTMDGSGPSGITLDFSKGQIFVIDFQWLSLGTVRFGVEIGGTITYVHEHDSANHETIPWASTPNLPLRYQMITTGSSPASSMRVVCAAVISEGGTDDVGMVRYKSTAGAAVTATSDNVVYAVVGIRLKSTHLGAAIKMLNAAVHVQTGSDKGEWILVFNPTVAGTFTYSDLANSAIQTALGASANTVTDGTEIGGDFVESAAGGKGAGSNSKVLNNSIMLGAKIDNTPDTIVLCFRPNSGSGAVEVEGALTWREL